MKTKKHIDGIWHTTEFEYKGRKIMIKSANGRGMKCHVFAPGYIEGQDNKVAFTLKYSYIKPSELLANAKRKIDNGL